MCVNALQIVVDDELPRRRLTLITESLRILREREWAKGTTAELQAEVRSSQAADDYNTMLELTSPHLLFATVDVARGEDTDWISYSLAKTGFVLGVVAGDTVPPSPCGPRSNVPFKSHKVSATALS